ncbi:hypothetical protein PG989_011027 [Apiospora arundinis]
MSAPKETSEVTPEETVDASWKAFGKTIQEVIAGVEKAEKPAATLPLMRSDYPDLFNNQQRPASDSSPSPSTPLTLSEIMSSTGRLGANMNSRPSSNSLLDRHNLAIAEILKRFLNMVVAATEPIDEGYTPEKASLNQMTMATETAALIKAIENLLQLTRELKRLWITGPLRPTPEVERENRERDAAIDARTERIVNLFNKWIVKREEQQRTNRKSQKTAATAGENNSIDVDVESATSTTFGAAAAAGPTGNAGGIAAASGTMGGVGGSD